MNQSLKIIATGGTFDKRYDPLTGNLTFGESHLNNLLPTFRLHPAPIVEVILMMDSLDMQESHRQTILDSVRNSTENQIVIIHGTDTMAATAQVLGTANLNKTIVLTGAMVPLDIANSDANFNLGFAMGVAKTKPPGTFIAMNGTVYAWNNVRKNRDLGIFEAM